MTPRLYEVLAPLATIASLTAISLIPPLTLHIAQAEEQSSRIITKQRAQMQRYEKFIINCLSGRNLLVDKTDAVMCIRV